MNMKTHIKQTKGRVSGIFERGLQTKIRLSLSTTFQTVRNFFHTKDLFQPIKIKEIFYPKVGLTTERNKKVQVGKDQEKAQSEKDSHSKNRGGKKPILYHENIS